MPTARELDGGGGCALNQPNVEPPADAAPTATVPNSCRPLVEFVQVVSRLCGAFQTADLPLGQAKVRLGEYRPVLVARASARTDDQRTVPNLFPMGAPNLRTMRHLEVGAWVLDSHTSTNHRATKPHARREPRRHPSDPVGYSVTSKP
jgi:hypothetical protein